MNPIYLLFAFLAYTVLLFVIARITSRQSDRKSFYIGGRKSNWFLVAYGMIGASLSGVTFMSVPGMVYGGHFHYFQMILAFSIGYSIVAFILLPLYYRLNLTSIYAYLEQRFGFYSYQTGAIFFIVSRLLGAAIRTYVVIMVLHTFVLQNIGIPFWLAGLLFILLAIAYTYQGGVKTIVWTDTFQTTFMLLAVVITVMTIAAKLGMSFGTLCETVMKSDYVSIIDWNWESKSFFLKHLIAGIFMPVATVGLDQGMMQKNLSCKNIGEAKKNMMTNVALMIAANFMFLFLGAALAVFCSQNNLAIGVPEGIAKADHIFPTVALNYLGTFVGLCFFIGLISAAYPTCANALTALTTSVCIDLLGLEKKNDWTENRKKWTRYAVQGIVTVLFWGIILFVNARNNEAVVQLVYDMAAYTYGPLLALYMFGLFSKRRVWDISVPFVCVLSPLFCFILERWNLIGQFAGLFRTSPTHFTFGFSLLLINALFTAIGLWIFSQREMEE